MLFSSSCSPERFQLLHNLMWKWCIILSAGTHWKNLRKAQWWSNILGQAAFSVLLKKKSDHIYWAKVTQRAWGLTAGARLRPSVLVRPPTSSTVPGAHRLLGPSGVASRRPNGLCLRLKARPRAVGFGVFHSMTDWIIGGDASLFSSFLPVKIGFLTRFIIMGSHTLGVDTQRKEGKDSNTDV